MYCRYGDSMKIDNELHEGDVLKELPVRFKQYRIASDMTQADLAKRSTVSLRTISRFERGNEIGLLTIIKLLKALNIAQNLEVLIPDMTKRPSYYFGNNSSRKRVRSSKKTETAAWKWGDEE